MKVGRGYWNVCYNCNEGDQQSQRTIDQKRKEKTTNFVQVKASASLNFCKNKPNQKNKKL